MGGDEFVVVLGDLRGDPQVASIQAKRIPEKIRDELSRPYQLGATEYRSSASIEALLRWLQPEPGMVSPAQFIPLAEETGMILPIGQWGLETACRQPVSWQASSQLSRLSIAVNVSARQFREPDFISTVQQSLRTHGIPPGLLKLALTESMVLDDVEDSIAKMVELKMLGVTFAMDNFGTGSSSLSYLAR